MKRIVTLSILCLAVLSWLVPSAHALAPFKKAFQEKYVDKSSHQELKDAFKTASCNTCHVKDQKKDVRNAYGDELAKLIEGDANKRMKEAGKNGDEARKAEEMKILQELEKAFEEVAKLKSKSGQTYGELIEAGQLPSTE